MSEPRVPTLFKILWGWPDDGEYVPATEEQVMGLIDATEELLEASSE